MAGRTAGIPPSGFERALIELNGLDAAGFAGWILEPGMGFREPAAWWRPGRRRAAPHEGLDLRDFRDARGGRRGLGAGALVPAPWRGEVASLREDFLGYSVFVAHGPQAGGRRLHSVLGHLVPRAGIAPGTALAAGEVVGSIADPAARGRSPAPHLHLTLALVPADLPPERLGWDLLRPGTGVELLDPAALLSRYEKGHSPRDARRRSSQR